MACQEEFSLPEGLLEQICARGLDGIDEAVRLVVNAAMRQEREAHLNASAYERHPGRAGHANGYKPKTVKTRVGAITFDVPQVREGGFHPGALEKGLRSERALNLALAEMYVLGVSTRKVSRITEQLCGVELTSTQVSRAAAELDGIPWKFAVADFNRKFCTLEHQVFGTDNELLGKGKQSLLFVSAKDYSLLDIPPEVYTAFLPYA